MLGWRKAAVEDHFGEYFQSWAPNDSIWQYLQNKKEKWPHKITLKSLKSNVPQGPCQPRLHAKEAITRTQRTNCTMSWPKAAQWPSHGSRAQHCHRSRHAAVFLSWKYAGAIGWCSVGVPFPHAILTIAIPGGVEDSVMWWVTKLPCAKESNQHLWSDMLPCICFSIFGPSKW